MFLKGKTIFTSPRAEVDFSVTYKDIPDFPTLEYLDKFVKLNFEGCTFYVQENTQVYFDNCVFDNCSFRGADNCFLLFEQCAVNNTPLPLGATVRVNKDYFTKDHEDNNLGRIKYLSSCFSGVKNLIFNYNKGNVPKESYMELMKAMPGTKIIYWSAWHDKSMEYTFSVSQYMREYFKEHDLPFIAAGREYEIKPSGITFMYSEEELTGHSEVKVVFKGEKQCQEQ